MGKKNILKIILIISLSFLNTNATSKFDYNPSNVKVKNGDTFNYIYTLVINKGQQNNPEFAIPLGPKEGDTRIIEVIDINSHHFGDNFIDISITNNGEKYETVNALNGVGSYIIYTNWTGWIDKLNETNQQLNDTGLPKYQYVENTNFFNISSSSFSNDYSPDYGNITSFNRLFISYSKYNGVLNSRFLNITYSINGVIAKQQVELLKITDILISKSTRKTNFIIFSPLIILEIITLILFRRRK